MAHVRMPESRSIAIELLRIRFCNQRLHLLIQRRTRIGSQNLEERQSGSQIDRIIDGRADAIWCIGEKPKHIEAFGRDPFAPAVSHDVALMSRRYGPSANAFERRRIHRLDSKSDRAQSGAIQEIN